jgi:hypothetical protein
MADLGYRYSSVAAVPEVTEKAPHNNSFNTASLGLAACGVQPVNSIVRYIAGTAMRSFEQCANSGTVS